MSYLDAKEDRKEKRKISRISLTSVDQNIPTRKFPGLSPDSSADTSSVRSLQKSKIIFRKSILKRKKTNSTGSHPPHICPIFQCHLPHSNCVSPHLSQNGRLSWKSHAAISGATSGFQRRIAARVARGNHSCRGPCQTFIQRAHMCSCKHTYDSYAVQTFTCPFSSSTRPSAGNFSFFLSGSTS